MTPEARHLDVETIARVFDTWAALARLGQHVPEANIRDLAVELRRAANPEKE